MITPEISEKKDKVRHFVKKCIYSNRPNASYNKCKCRRIALGVITNKINDENNIIVNNVIVNNVKYVNSGCEFCK